MLNFNSVLLLLMLFSPFSSLLAKDSYSQMDKIMLFKQGMTEYKGKNYTKAEKILNQLLKIQPDPSLARIARIKIEEIKRVRLGKKPIKNFKNISPQNSTPDKQNFRKKMLSGFKKKGFSMESIYARSIEKLVKQIHKADQNKDSKSALKLRKQLLGTYAYQQAHYKNNNDEENVAKVTLLKNSLSKEIDKAEQKIVSQAKEKGDINRAPEDLQQIAKISINRAQRLRREGNYVDAEKEYLIGIKWYEDIGHAGDILRYKKQLAEMYEEDGSYDKARTLYKTLIVLSKNSLARRIQEIKESSAKSREKYEKVKTDQKKLWKKLGPKFQKEQAARDRKYQESLNGMFGKKDIDPEKSKIDSAKNQETHFKNKLKAIDKKTGNTQKLADKMPTERPLNEANKFTNFAKIKEIFDHYAFNNDLEGGLEFSKKALDWAEDQQTLNFTERNQIDLITASINIKLFFKTNNTNYLNNAEKHYLKAIEVVSKKMPLLISAYKPWLADVYALQNRYEMAESIYQEAGKKYYSNEFRHGIALGKIAYMQADYTKAENSILKWIERNNDSSSRTKHNTYIGAKYILSQVYNKMGRQQQSTDLIAEILKKDNKYQNQAIWGMGSNSRKNFINQLQLSKNNLLLNYFSETKTPASNSLALYYSLSRKGALLQIASAINAVAKSAENPALKSIVDEINIKQKKLADLLLAPGKRNPQAVDTLEAELDKLESNLSRKVQKLAHSQTEITPDQVTQTLGQQQVLIDFHVYKKTDNSKIKSLDFWDKGVPEVDYKDEYLMAIVADGSKIELVELGKLESISSAIRHFRNQINNVVDQVQLATTSNKLYTLIWQPLNTYLKNKKRIYLIPDGVLHLLPFKSIQDENRQYLAEKHNLITLSSARDIVLSPLAGNSEISSIFASPVYQPDQKTELALAEKQINMNRNIARTLDKLQFGPLPGTLKEGHAIKNLMDSMQHPAQLFTLNEATEKAIKAVQHPKVLHLATHGYFLEQPKIDELSSNQSRSLQNSDLSDPLSRSGLVFSNANISLNKGEFGKENDGILTALEVLKLNLLGTDLVTLSACETGVGEIKTGEGVYSLSRAFQEAGARSVLSSLWSISDDGTEAFMKHFYQHYLNSESAQSALQKTQLEFIHSNRWNHPFYWGAFVVTGKK